MSKLMAVSLFINIYVVFITPVNASNVYVLEVGMYDPSGTPGSIQGTFTFSDVTQSLQSWSFSGQNEAGERLYENLGYALTELNSRPTPGDELNFNFLSNDGQYFFTVEVPDLFMSLLPGESVNVTQAQAFDLAFSQNYDIWTQRGAGYVTASFPQDCSATVLFLTDKIYNIDTTKQSEVSIMTNGSIIVNAGVSVIFNAPTITLTSGFHAKSGSQFTATAMPVSCNSEVLAKRSLAQADEQPTDIQTTQPPEYLIAQWLTAADIPESLQRLFAEKNMIAHEIQSDASGDIIVFSTPTALLDNDTNDLSDIYAYHSLSESLSIISHTIDNTSGNGSSTQARINGSGAYIIYRSEANNLNCSSKENHTDDNNAADIYLYDIAGRQTIRVSWEEDGSQTQHDASNPSIAGDAPYMVYDKGDNLRQQHVYGVDTTVDSLSGIKYSTDYNNFGEPIDNSRPGISADGRYVAYLGQSKDENKTCTQHLLDRETGNSQVTLCPDTLADNPEQWFPFFDSQAENVHWQQIK